jgi:PAS domain S-box-containing protein
MSLLKKCSDNPLELRKKAEEKARQNAGQAPENDISPSPDEFRRLMHELQVHQFELEMQNDELRRVAAELEVTMTRYFDLYDLAPVGYCTISEEGLIQEANLTASAMLKVARGGLARQPMVKFILPEDQDIFYRHRQRMFSESSSPSFELRMRPADGSPLWACLEVTLVRKTPGDSVCRIALIDISERKRAEEVQIKLQDELHQARKMESVGRLAGGVAHEFNNMLGVILGNAELALLKSADDSFRSDSLREIIKAAKHSAEVTQQLLSFARKQLISPKVLDIGSALDGTLKMLRLLIGENRELVWTFSTGLWPVKMDPVQLDQILTNLCINARDAISGFGSITIEARNVSLDAGFCREHPGIGPGDFVRMSVSDNGQGMSPETLDHLFEPFFTTKEVGKGTGLGLSTVFGIVKQNQGFLLVRSEKGKGSTFDIYLPRHNAPPDSGKASEIPPGSGVQGRETVLVVEDEPGILRMLSHMLGSLGYSVLSAATPNEAIRLAETNSEAIHLLITDVMLPTMNGQVLANHLLGRNSRLKCLFISGYSAELITSEGVLSPNVHFLKKPFSMESLAEKIREALAGA